MPMLWEIPCFMALVPGAEPTASAVIADIVDVARAVDSSSANVVPLLGRDLKSLRQQPIMPIEEIETSFYMRFSALDKPGVLSDITKIMADSGISIEAIIQKEQPVGEDYVNVIILTNVTREKVLNGALQRIEQLESVGGKVTFIRVEHLDQ